MKVFVDLETLQLIEGPGFRNPVTALRFKRGDSAKLEVSFLESGITPTTIGNPLNLEIQFGIKPRSRYDVGYLVHDAAWMMPDAEAESPVYRCAPSFNTEELNSALGVGSSTGSELAEITLMGEITWREGSGDPTSTRTFLVIVENDVNRGDEGAPTNAEPAYPAPQDIARLNSVVRFDAAQSLTAPQKAQARANIGASGSSPISLGTALTGTITLSLTNGTYQYGAATGNVTFAVPSAAAAEGDHIKVYLQASGGDRTLDFVAGIKKPSDSGATWPKTMTAAKTYIFQLAYTHGSWCLVSLVGGY